MKYIIEYSDKTVNDTIDRWRADYPGIDDNVAKQLIQRFDQIKSGISSKIDQVALGDDLRKGNNYLNIDKYSFGDMVKLIRSYPENDKKVLKDAINKFKEEDQIDIQTSTHYVKRFLANKRALKYATENGTEDGHYSKDQVLKLIPRNLINNNAYLDPRVWKFSSLEQILDTLFPFQGKVEDGDENTASTNADLVYEKDGLEIYKGDAQHKCVSYNPTENGRKKYSWCIAQPGNSMYDNYRFQGTNNRMFYFVFDRKLGEDHLYHAFVIHVGENNKNYWITNARNSGDVSFFPWNSMKNKIPAETWARLENLEPVFKYKAPSKSEISAAALRGKKLSVNDFSQLDYDTKEEYIKSNAGKLTQEILNVLDKELKNLAINFGQKFTFDNLKENEGLAKRYAIFRFRHTDYSQEPIPLPFIQYLDEPSKEKYLEKFNDNITFEYLDKYFGETLTKKYVNDELNSFGYLPKEAVKYIEDPKQKSLFLTYIKLFENWKFDKNFNKENLEELTEMSTQDINPLPFMLENFKTLTNSQKQVIIKLAEKVNGKEKYSTLLYGLPYIIKDEEKYLFLFPESSTDNMYESWILANENGDIIKNKISGESEMNGYSIYSGFPNLEEDPRRIFDIKEFKIK